MTKYFLFIAIFLIPVNASFGCMTSLPSISNFDNSHYVFIGEIVEVIEKDNYISQVGKTRGKVLGFKIKLSENIYSPKQATYFEVFPLSITSHCSLESDTEMLRKLFSVGAQVRVSGKEVAVSKNQLITDSTIGLETSIFNHGSISRNDINENLRSSTKSVYDYSLFNPKPATSEAEYQLANSYYTLPEFELRKDLLRLKQAKTEQEKAAILERLVYYPHFNRLDFIELLRLNLQNQDKVSALEKKWEQRVQDNSRRK